MSVTGIGLSVGGGGANVVPLSVTENGTYTAEEGTAYSPVSVDVPYKTANFTFRFNNAIPAGLFVKCSVPYMNSGNIFTIVSTTKYSGQSQTIVLGESGHTTATIVTEGWQFTIISGNATFTDNDHLRVNITGDCVLSVEPVVGYQSDLAKFLTHGTTELKAEDWVGDTSTWAYQCYRQTRLVTVTFPFGYTGIQSYTFSNCSGLRTVNLPSTIQNIYANAFEYCTALETITLPAVMRLLLNSAFVGCSSLKSVTIEATTPPTLGTGVFSGTHADLVIYVPAESVEAYKAATNWSTYADKIQAIPNS